jgi:hypothetical protein
LVRKLIDKGVISKEEMSGIVDEAGTLLSQGNAVAMRQALQSLRSADARNIIVAVFFWTRKPRRHSA